MARYPLCEGLCRRLLARSPWQVLCGSCCAKSLWSKTPVKVQALKRDLWKRSLFSSPSLGQDPFNRSLSKISAYKDLAKNVKISFVPHIMIYHLSSKISWQDTPLCEGLCRRLRARSPWQVLCGSCCAKSLCRLAIFTKCLQEISRENLCKRSQSKISAQSL